MADDIVFRIRAEGTDKFIKDLKQAGVVVEDTGDKVEESNEKIGKSYKKIGVAVAAAFSVAAIKQFATESAKLADKQLKAEAKLLAALNGRQDIQDRLIKQAKQLQSVTTIGDEDIIAQQAYLASLEFTEKQIKKIIKASADLAAGANISLESAVRNVAKTYSGLSGELGELIPQLRELTQEQLKNGEGVEVLTELYEGQAEVLRNTGLGAVQALQNAVGDLQEEFGTALLEGLQPLANTLQGLAENEDVINFFRNLGTILGDALVTAGFALEVVARLGGDLANLFGLNNKAAESTDAYTEAVAEQKEEFIKQGRARLDYVEAEIKTLEVREKSKKLSVEELEDLLTFRSERESLIEVLDREQLILNSFNEAQRLRIDLSGLTIDKEKELVDQTEDSIVSLENLVTSIETLFISLSPAAQAFDKTVIDTIQKISLAASLAATSVAFASGEIVKVNKAISDAESEDAEETKKTAEEITAEKIALAQQYQSEAGQIAQAGLQFTSGIFATEQARLQEKFDQGLISEKEFQKESAEIRRKQAIADKAQAVFQATLNIANAVTKSFGQGGGLLGPAFAAISIAATTAQLAAILATPIPQFAEGTKGRKRAPSGFAWVGEEGPELMQMRGGEKIITNQDSEELMRLMAGYGIPVQFNTLEKELYKPMTKMEALITNKQAPLDLNPLVRSNDMNRFSLGKKLDRINENLVALGQTRKMTRS